MLLSWCNLDHNAWRPLCYQICLGKPAGFCQRMGSQADVHGQAGEVRPQEVVRGYDGLGQATKELKEVAAQLGGSAGELLMDECSAKVWRGLERVLPRAAWQSHSRKVAKAAAVALEMAACNRHSLLASLMELCSDAALVIAGQSSACRTVLVLPSNRCTS